MQHILTLIFLLFSASNPMRGTSAVHIRAASTPPSSPTASPVTAVITTDGDVITGISLPRFGTLCSDVEVRGNPHEWSQVLYVLPAGEVVRLREQGGDGRSWVMIEPAKWIPFSVVCWGDD